MDEDEASAKAEAEPRSSNGTQGSVHMNPPQLIESVQKTVDQRLNAHTAKIEAKLDEMERNMKTSRGRKPKAKIEEVDVAALPSHEDDLHYKVRRRNFTSEYLCVYAYV